MIIIALMLSSTALSTASLLTVIFASFAFAVICSLNRSAISVSALHSPVNALVNSSLGLRGQSCRIQLGLIGVFKVWLTPASRD